MELTPGEPKPAGKLSGAAKNGSGTMIATLTTRALRAHEARQLGEHGRLGALLGADDLDTDVEVHGRPGPIGGHCRGSALTSKG
jgi:hypothetical protein